MERETSFERCKTCTAPLPPGNISTFCKQCISKMTKGADEKREVCPGCGLSNGLHKHKCYWDPAYKD